MRVLVACEESQEVCKAFREKGHEAYSCDIQECSGCHPEWHILGDVLPILDGNCMFKTMDGRTHYIDGEWDIIIAFPPCTDLAVSGARWFEEKRENNSQLKSIEFFARILNAKCNRIAIENPVNIIGGNYIKKWFPEYGYLQNCTQRIQPYEFGHPYTKTTCLWLKNLSKLTPTNVLEEPEGGWRNKHLIDGKYRGFGKEFTSKDGKWLRYGDPQVKKLRSKTFPGVAKAMAEQWGKGE